MRKTVMITGATDGIGKALAIMLSGEYNLALCGRNEDKMNRLLEQLEGCCVYAECFDITDSLQRRSFCRRSFIPWMKSLSEMCSSKISLLATVFWLRR